MELSGIATAEKRFVAMKITDDQTELFLHSTIPYPNLPGLRKPAG